MKGECKMTKYNNIDEFKHAVRVGDVICIGVTPSEVEAFDTHDGRYKACDFYAFMLHRHGKVTKIMEDGICLSNQELITCGEKFTVFLPYNSITEVVVMTSDLKDPKVLQHIGTHLFETGIKAFGIGAEVTITLKADCKSNDPVAVAALQWLKSQRKDLPQIILNGKILAFGNNAILFKSILFGPLVISLSNITSMEYIALESDIGGWVDYVSPTDLTDQDCGKMMACNLGAGYITKITPGMLYFIDQSSGMECSVAKSAIERIYFL